MECEESQCTLKKKENRHTLDDIELKINLFYQLIIVDEQFLH